MKKITALTMALCLAFLCLSGCGSTEIRSYSDDAASKTETRDMSAAYAAYDPDTVVMTVGKTDITWQEYFYWVNSCVQALDSDNGSLITDWSADCPHGEDGESYAAYTARRVKEAIVQYHAMSDKAEELGVTLTDADNESIASTLQTDMTNYCGSDATEADFETYLKSIYMTRDYYDYVNKVALLYYDTFDKVFGENGEKCSDEDTLAFAKENNYMTANQILISTLDSEGAELSADEVAQKKTKAQELADQLQSITDHTALVAKFKELRTANDDDTGAAYYPDGYCFTDGKMVDEFQNACENLKEYQVSDPVKSSYGYHIILRMPTTANDVVDYVSETQTHTLRYYAAVDQYDAVVGGWIDDATVQWQGDFETLDIAALLKK